MFSYADCDLTLCHFSLLWMDRRDDRAPVSRLLDAQDVSLSLLLELASRTCRPILAADVLLSLCSSLRLIILVRISLEDKSLRTYVEIVSKCFERKKSVQSFLCSCICCSRPETDTLYQLPL